MKIDIKESCIVKPVEAMPRGSLWLSILDKLVHPNWYPRTCYLYRSNEAANFFDPTVLKDALSRALVHFYPAAGRLKIDDKGRMVIDCNDEGVFFSVAEADGVMNDLGYSDNCIPTNFCPSIDTSQGMSERPLVLAQVTYFKCGGVCLGLAISHHLSDGRSSMNFINTWARLARGLEVTTPPLLDRRGVLHPHSPPQPQFEHIEYQAPNYFERNGEAQGSLGFRRFRVSQDQMNALKAKCQEDDENVRYTSFEVLAGHAWRCVTLARQLPKDQETRLLIQVDGRSRLQPPVSEGYFGNVTFTTVSCALADELYSNPLKFVVRKVHEAIARLNNDYLRSAIDYLELHHGDFNYVPSVECPNLSINSWARLSFHDADFGWGAPIHTTAVGPPLNGKSYFFPTTDGSLLYGVTLSEEQSNLFKKAFYDI